MKVHGLTGNGIIRYHLSESATVRWFIYFFFLLRNFCYNMFGFTRLLFFFFLVSSECGGSGAVFFKIHNYSSFCVASYNKCYLRSCWQPS